MDNETQNAKTAVKDELAGSTDRSGAAEWDTGTNEDFFKYYEEKSLSPETAARFRRSCEMLLRVRHGVRNSHTLHSLDVLDVGCGAGAQASPWLALGHRYQGLDVNRPLIELARRRAAEQGLGALFEVGSATALPWPDSSFDICLLPELLEHVADWRACVSEAARVLRPRGIMYINTSNKLCPVQQEFNLPFYSWYPALLKRYFEKRATTDWKSLANYAKYPAVNWFSFYGLRRELSARGFVCLDRFDASSLASASAATRALLTALRSVPPLRLLGHMCTPYTLVIAVKAAQVAQGPGSEGLQ